MTTRTGPALREERRNERDRVRNPLVDVRRGPRRARRRAARARRALPRSNACRSGSAHELEPALARARRRHVPVRPRDDRHPVPAPRQPLRELEHLHDAAGVEAPLLEDLEDGEGSRVIWRSRDRDRSEAFRTLDHRSPVEIQLPSPRPATRLRPPARGRSSRAGGPPPGARRPRGACESGRARSMRGREPARGDGREHARGTPGRSPSSSRGSRSGFQKMSRISSFGLGPVVAPHVTMRPPFAAACSDVIQVFSPTRIHDDVHAALGRVRPGRPWRRPPSCSR